MSRAQPRVEPLLGLLRLDRRLPPPSPELDVRVVGEARGTNSLRGGLEMHSNASLAVVVTSSAAMLPTRLFLILFVCL